MNLIEPAILILLFTIVSVPIANRFRLPLEVFLIIGSCFIGFTSGLQGLEINPRIIFNLFLPLILFNASYFISIHNFKSEIRPIGLLSVGLVIFTMFIVAFITKWLFPHFSWAESFLFGAIVSPTDATSSTAIIKKLNAPRRLINILEGESLINDATALILFRFSLAAVVGGYFSLGQAFFQFIVIAIGGVVIGLAIGKISIFILKRINFVAAEITLTIITALATYLIAEMLHCSGVVATVTCGLYFGFHVPELNLSRGRIFAKATWDTIIFMINGFIFTLIGLNLPVILSHLHPRPVGLLIFYGCLIGLITIVIRIIWVFISAHISRWLIPSIRLKDPKPLWPTLFIIGWCGMRGIVSIAVALSLPVFIAAPTIYFPHRDLFLLLTYCVIVITLILPVFSLPFLLHKFHLINSEDKVKQESLARLRSLEVIVSELKDKMKDEDIPETVFVEFYKQVERRIKVVKTQPSDMPYSTLDREYQATKRLMLAAIESERKTLIDLRKSGEVSDDDVFHLLLEELDLEEMRTKTLRV